MHRRQRPCYFSPPSYFVPIFPLQGTTDSSLLQRLHTMPETLRTSHIFRLMKTFSEFDSLFLKRGKTILFALQKNIHSLAEVFEHLQIPFIDILCVLYSILKFHLHRYET